MAVVLIVEDEVGIATLLKDVLADEGHRILVASNGRQALSRASEERPDVIITDFMMPTMDGAALLKAIAADSHLKGTPVVIISSLPEASVAERCSGYALFIRKPFKIYDLINQVAALLEKKP